MSLASASARSSASVGQLLQAVSVVQPREDIPDGFLVDSTEHYVVGLVEPLAHDENDEQAAREEIEQVSDSVVKIVDEIEVLPEDFEPQQGDRAEEDDHIVAMPVSMPIMRFMPL